MTRSSSITVPWLSPTDPFPSVDTAMPEETGLGGLLAVGADLSPDRLLTAYRHGIFPWYSEPQPILWWSPDPRMVLEIERLRITRSLAKTIRRVAMDKAWDVRIDSAFEHVIMCCKNTRREGQSGTWITDAIVDGYVALHRLGYAHSFEAWHDDQLVGGGYGIAIGRMFYGESMFALETDASKIAFVALVEFLHRNDVPMIDCQQNTRHLASFGAREISRIEFTARVKELTQQQGPTQWPSRLSLHETARFVDTVYRSRQS
ncbi:MAG TPA: leucyl/phenylalanyl-tRNA--protein transferase [Burkholderiaceae bacterium]|nr:leucyl/phenylalanyl-tRNA--protein transferase [Burkholderiaceae bacterium]